MKSHRSKSEETIRALVIDLADQFCARHSILLNLFNTGIIVSTDDIRDFLKKQLSGSPAPHGEKKKQKGEKRAK